MNAQHIGMVARLKQGLLTYFERVPDQVLARKWLVWLIVAAATAFAVAGMGRAKFDMTIEGWFADDDPTMVAMDRLRARFGSDDHLYIVYQPKDGNVFSSASLETVRALRRDLLERIAAAPDGSPLKRIVKITALDNAPVLKVEGDALVSRNLVGPKIPATQKELDEIVKTAEGQRALPQNYFSRDYRYGGILIETNFGAIPVDDAPPQQAAPAPAGGPQAGVDTLDMSFSGQAEEKRVRFKPTDLGEYLDLMNEVKVTLNKPQFAGQLQYYANGNPASTEYNLQVLEEMGLLYSVMLVIMVTVLWFLFRSFSGVLWPSLVVILSVVWTVGFAGWLGVPFTGHLLLTVVMILVIGIADSIHILSGYEYFRNKGQDHRSALRSAYHSSGNACFLTAATSMVGLLSVVFTSIVPIQVFGITTAAGIGLALLFTIYVLPLMIDLWWVRRKEGAPAGKLVPNAALLVQRGLRHVFPIVQRLKYAIVAVSVVVFAVFLYGISQLKVDSDIKEMFPKGAQIRENIDIADQYMAGSQTLEIYFDLGGEYAFHDPFVLNRIDKLQKKIEGSYDKYVVRTLSVVDVLKKSYQVLNEDRPEMNAVPPTREVTANAFFMFDSSNPTQRRKMVADDYSQARITVYLRNAGSYEYTKVFNEIQKDVDETVTDLRHNYRGAKGSITGTFTLLMQGSDYLSWNSLSSFAWAIVTISVILLLIFGSFKAGLISVFANAVPVTLTFGLMGLLGVPLDFTTVLVAPIVLGIATDDTVHFLTHYRQNVALDGNVNRALAETLAEAGQAVSFTALILALGFGVLALSSTPGNANVGIFGSLAVLTGLACELFLTPALVLIFGLPYKKSAEAPAHVQPEPSA